MSDMPGLVGKLREYTQSFKIVNALHRFAKGELSSEELFDSFLEPYCGMGLELYEKIAPVLTSDEIWKDGRTVYQTRVPLESGETADVTINREAGFVVVEKHGKKDVKFEYSLKVRKEQ